MATGLCEALAIVDDDDEQLIYDNEEASRLLAMTGDLEGATVSACPHCKSRVLAVVALVDIIESAPPLPKGTELLELADDAPTLHLYVQDLVSECEHDAWRDPGAEEWAEVFATPVPTLRRH
ncbi:MAG: hypothetical protein JWL73_2175 [Actinomycetia bacterium]|jgi:hypothetical protein|nr:hypothetical protein [Actinomycetes bacterium]